MQRIEYKEMTSCAARRAIDDSIGRDRESGNLRLAGRDHIERRIAQVASVNPYLRHDGAVILERALCNGKCRGAKKRDKGADTHAGLYIRSARRYGTPPMLPAASSGFPAIRRT